MIKEANNNLSELSFVVHDDEQLSIISHFIYDPLMENLGRGLFQGDKDTYLGLPPGGSKKYEYQHLTGKSVAEGEQEPRGFAADDLYR